MSMQVFSGSGVVPGIAIGRAISIQALPIVGTHAGHALFRAALGRSVGSCAGSGCGCLAVLIGLIAAAAAFLS